ncbi:MAG: type II toxin-antitoxin system VapC family toxin [Myxococcales bacterium]|nr:type II toxin-antitoxin system VapC family toxin [Myxococcales bacterium]
MRGLVLDASAVIAMLESESDAPAIREAFVATSPRWIGAVGVMECAIVLERRRGGLAKAGLDALLARFSVRTLAFDGTQVVAAHRAYQQFGKGRHPAALNLGDCCAYAASKALALPLLQKGDDFRRTDLALVHWWQSPP